MARRLLEAGKLPESEALYRQDLAKDPACFDALSGLATITRATGRLAESIRHASQAVAQRPDDPASHSNLGLSLLANRQLIEAAATFQRAIELAPSVAILHHNLGIALQHQGRDQEAANAFRRAIECDPGVPNSYSMLGSLLLARGGREEALQCFREAASLDPNSAKGKVQLAQLLFEEGKAQEAEECVRIAIKIDPNLCAAHELLGMICQRSGRFDEAVESFEQALTLRPAQVGPLYGITYARRTTEEDRPRIDLMNRLLSESHLTPPERGALHYALGKANEDLGDYEAAMRHFVRANEIELGRMKASGRTFKPAAYEGATGSMIRLFGNSLIEQAISSCSDSEKPVLVVGMMRSGTTLIEQILSCHSEVGAGGEQGFWQREARFALDQLRKGTTDLGPLAPRYLELLENLAPGKARVTDKLPNNYMLLGLIHVVFPRARIIHCRRNPLDNCLSIFLTPSRNAPEYAHDRESIVFAYRQYERLMEHWRSVLPKQVFLEVQYEDLTAEPERVTRQMIEFCGLEWDEACLRPEENPRVVATPSMWQVRQPVYQSSVDRWRRYEPWLGALKELLPGVDKTRG